MCFLVCFQQDHFLEFLQDETFHNFWGRTHDLWNLFESGKSNVSNPTTNFTFKFIIVTIAENQDVILVLSLSLYLRLHYCASSFSGWLL